MARTLNCAAWVQEAAKMPVTDSGSDFANEGTLLHNCAEEYFNSATINTAEMLEQGRTYKTATLTQQLIDDKLEPAIAAVVKILEQYDAWDTYICEPFVELIPAEAGGSIDMLAVSGDRKTMLVIDYKFGHVTVHAEENDQMMFYALCSRLDPATAAMFTQADTMELTIVQPNADGDIADSWASPIKVLDQFELDVYAAIDASKEADPTPVSGSWCKYCPAAATCPIKTGLASQAMRLDVEIAADLSTALHMIPELEAWIKAANKLAHEQLDLGVAIEGFKLVNKRPSRVWNDLPTVEAKITKMRSIKKEDAFDFKLKSPAQMEKLFKAKDVDFDKVSDYISSVSSGTTVAKAGDKRPDASPVQALRQLAQKLK